MNEIDVREAESLARKAVEEGALGRSEAEALGRGARRHPGILAALTEAAAEAKRRAFGDIVTVSPNVFIPLTNLCRNRCTYCTFVKHPNDPDAKTYTLSEVYDTCAGARRAGCIEALMCLGDKPELSSKTYRAWLDDRGYGSTADYLADGCRSAIDAGMLPHTNAGLLSQTQLEVLRPLNASMGLMLESTSERLHEKGQAHFWAPDKKPALRLQMHREAGELKIPFTSGLLLGIGENIEERVDTLLAIRELGDRYGHIQEAIIQPFHPKDDTKMRGAPCPEEDDVVAWVAIARLMLGPRIHVQAPPNLANLQNPADRALLDRLLRAGVDDWGGVSPVSIDFINPEAPWPRLDVLRRQTEAAGQQLRYRLPVYPEMLLGKPDYFDPATRELAMSFAGADGFARNTPNEAAA